MSDAMARSAPISVDDYLDGETLTDIKHEYLDGEVVAMGGASAKHGLLVTGLGLAIGPHARRKGCQLFMADVKLRVDHADQTYFYYPDLLLACDPEDREPYYRRRPCMVVEVLSPSTERIDRREKLFAYQTIPSLREYLLVTCWSIRTSAVWRCIASARRCGTRPTRKAVSGSTASTRRSRSMRSISTRRPCEPDA